MALVLAELRVGPRTGTPSSRRSQRSHITSLVAEDIARYPDSTEDLETMGCFTSRKLKKYPKTYTNQLLIVLCQDNLPNLHMHMPEESTELWTSKKDPCQEYLVDTTKYNELPSNVVYVDHYQTG